MVRPPREAAAEVLTAIEEGGVAGGGPLSLVPVEWFAWSDAERGEFTDALLVTEAERALRDRLFWRAIDRGMAGGVAAWGKLYSDLRGWTGSASGLSADPTATERISEADAAALVRAAAATRGDDGDD